MSWAQWTHVRVGSSAQPVRAAHFCSNQKLFLFTRSSPQLRWRRLSDEVSLQWDNMRYIPQIAAPSAIINKPDQDLYPVLHRQSVSSRALPDLGENILTSLQWHKKVIIGKRDLIIGLSLNYVSSSRLLVSPLTSDPCKSHSSFFTVWTSLVDF